MKPWKQLLVCLAAISVCAVALSGCSSPPRQETNNPPQVRQNKKEE